MRRNPSRADHAAQDNQELVIAPYVISGSVAVGDGSTSGSSEPLQLGEVADAAGDRPREAVLVEVKMCELAQRAELDGNGAGEVVAIELGGESS